MFRAKRVSKKSKKRNRISTIKYVIVFGLGASAIMGVFAAAAMHTATGHVILSKAIDYVFG